MNDPAASAHPVTNQLDIAQIQALRQFNGTLKQFWPKFLSSVGVFISAQSAILTFKTAGIPWRQVGSWKNSVHSKEKDTIIESIFNKWMEENPLPEAPLYHELSEEKEDALTVLFIVPLITQNTSESIVALFIAHTEGSADAQTKLDNLALLNDVPASFQEHLNFIKAKSEVDSFATATDLLVLLNRQTRFLAANMTLVNELASRFKCDRVSIGWLKSNKVVVTAISHMEKFEKKMDAVRELQASMEESLEQNFEVLSPPPSDATYISRDHSTYRSSQGIGNVFSIPLRKGDEAVGVITFERGATFNEQEFLRLRLIGDQLTQRMLDLQKWDRWFGARWYYWFQEKMQRMLNVEFTLRKALCIAGVALCLWMVFGSLTYRVKAPFIVRSENVRYIPAPNNGYIKSVNIEKGDLIPQGSVLISLDDRELVLEEAAATADKIRFEREIVKARAENKLVEMRIAEAQLQQSIARLEKVRYFIEQSTITSPFTGVVVEGDLKEKIGVPVQQGDLLYKIAQLDTLYSELQIAEDDIHELDAGSQGHVAFASNPNEKFPVTVERIEPLAQSIQEGNIFIVHCAFDDKAEQWWRPGMSGVAKIEVGDRSPLYIVTHKTLDYLRLRFW